MGVNVLDPIEYGRLCAEIVPKAIETDQEFDRLVAQMEALDFKENPTPEKQALSATLAVLIQDYDDRHYPLPKTTPDGMIRFSDGTPKSEAGRFAIRVRHPQRSLRRDRWET
jgi:HTH-type transcriptional regulator/antitoxin HigA